MTKGYAQDFFRAKAPGIMVLLQRDFPISVDDAAAIVGNLGHECAGFTKLQEIAPTVKGSRGGYGWAQWTGPRRREYENYCARNGLSPSGDKANYGFLFVELTSTEKKAIPAVVKAKTLEGKVKAFELAYERAGAKHYDSRNRWARVALDAWRLAQPVALPDWALPSIAPVPTPKPAPQPAPEVEVIVADPEDLAKPAAKSKTFWTWLLTGVSTPFAVFGGFDWRVQLAIVVVIVGFAVYGIKRRADLTRAMRDLKAEFGG